MGDQTAVAASEDYGRDVEHVELLIQTFDSFLSSLAASKGRVTYCISTGQALIADGNPEHELIHSKLDETQQLWEVLKELAHERQEVNHSSASRKDFVVKCMNTLCFLFVCLETWVASFKESANVSRNKCCCLQVRTKLLRGLDVI